MGRAFSPRMLILDDLSQVPDVPNIPRRSIKPLYDYGPKPMKPYDIPKPRRLFDITPPAPFGHHYWEPTDLPKKEFMRLQRKALNRLARGLKLLRLHPILSALLTVQDLYDFAEWYREASIPAHLQYNPTGLQCISYSAAIDNPSIACGFQYYAKRGNYGSGGCNPWHYQNQAIGGGNPMALGYAVGPLQGGIYGCQRLNFAYVLRYDTVPNANNANVAWIPAKAGFTRWMPSNAFPRVPLAVRSGYRPKPEPEPGELPRAPRPSPQDKPYEVPAMEYDPHKNGGRGVPVRHGQLPPNKKKGNREKKGRDGIPRGFGVGAGLYGAATEFSDLADALYAGVPKSKRRPYQNPYEKAKAVWDNWDDMDWSAALNEFGRQHLTDKAIGKANSAVAKKLSRNPYWKRPVGPGAGNWAQRYNGRLPMVVD